MSISYLNRKGQTYFLCLGTTKTGRPRYYFTRKSKDKLMDKIPEGYTIRESVNGIVSLTKAGAVLLLEEEVNVVKREI